MSQETGSTSLSSLGVDWSRWNRVLKVQRNRYQHPNVQDNEKVSDCPRTHNGQIEKLDSDQVPFQALSLTTDISGSEYQFPGCAGGGVSMSRVSPLRALRANGRAVVS